MLNVVTIKALRKLLPCDMKEDRYLSWCWNTYYQKQTQDIWKDERKLFIAFKKRIYSRNSFEYHFILAEADYPHGLRWGQEGYRSKGSSSQELGSIVGATCKCIHGGHHVCIFMEIPQHSLRILFQGLDVDTWSDISSRANGCRFVYLFGLYSIKDYMPGGVRSLEDVQNIGLLATTVGMFPDYSLKV